MVVPGTADGPGCTNSCRMVPETVDVGHYQAPGPKLTSQPVDRHVSDLGSVALLDNHHGCRGCCCGSRPRMPVQPLMFVDRCEIARYTTQLYQLTVDARDRVNKTNHDRVAYNRCHDTQPGTVHTSLYCVSQLCVQYLAVCTLPPIPGVELGFRG